MFVSRVALAVSALILVTSAAMAADLPVKAPISAPPPPPVSYNWTGFYVGGNIGYGWGDNSATLRPSPDAASQSYWNPAFNAGAAPSRFGFNRSGVIGGVQVGYNYQINAWVLGVEADFQGANIDDTVNVSTARAPFVPGNFSSSQDLRWLGTIRGRMGAASDHFLVYATGGFAYGSVNYDLNFAFANSNDFHTISTTRTETGWTIGGGLEWAAWDRWSFKFEYLYVDLGNTSLVSTPGGRASNLATTLTEDFKNRYSIFRFGANYKF